MNIVSTFVVRALNSFSSLDRWSWLLTMAYFCLRTVSSSAVFFATRVVFHFGSSISFVRLVSLLLMEVVCVAWSFLYARRVTPWSCSSCWSVSCSSRWSLMFFLSCWTSWSKLSGMYAGTIVGPKRSVGGLEVLESSELRLVS